MKCIKIHSKDRVTEYREGKSRIMTMLTAGWRSEKATPRSGVRIKDKGKSSSKEAVVNSEGRGKERGSVRSWELMALLSTVWLRGQSEGRSGSR